MEIRPSFNLRPTIVPILQTKGMIAYARAKNFKLTLTSLEDGYIAKS